MWGWTLKSKQNCQHRHIQTAISVVFVISGITKLVWDTGWRAWRTSPPYEVYLTWLFIKASTESKDWQPKAEMTARRPYAARLSRMKQEQQTQSSRNSSFLGNRHMQHLQCSPTQLILLDMCWFILSPAADEVPECRRRTIYNMRVCRHLLA